MLGLRFCTRALSSCGKWGPLFIAVRGPLTIAASLVAEHRLQTHMLSNCGPRAQPLRGMWDPPRPGLEPVSSALTGRFSTTAPPGKPNGSSFDSHIILLMHYDPMTAKTLGHFILVTHDLSLLLFSTDVDISLGVQLQNPSLFLLHFILGYISSITQPHKDHFRFWFCHERNLLSLPALCLLPV